MTSSFDHTHQMHQEGVTMKQQVKTNQLLKHLIKLTEQVSRGRYGKPEEIFELTKTGTYPDAITDLAESFGMMIVKVEAREFHLQQTIENLKRANRELDDAKKRLARENTTLKDHLRQKFSPTRIIGQSNQIRELLKTIEKIADTSINILITGETGTGKELFAKAIHYHSSRNTKPFLALNCSALPEKLIESELFGIEKGVATGVEKRIGKIEHADGGTLFLDEIGDMPVETQTKILRVLQEQELERIGGRKTIPVDIRIIAATNKNLKNEITEKKFREDLYYRLNGAQLHVPPLRERKDDIPLLLNSFVEYYAKNLNKYPIKLSADTIAILKAYSWPGNVRELEHEMERAVALACSDSITVDDLSKEITHFHVQERGETGDGQQSLMEMEKKAMQKVLAETGGNKSEAARRLGLSREGFRKKLKRYALE